MRRGKGIIYYICCPETARLKIGFTKRAPEARLRALQTGSPTRLFLMAMQAGSIEAEQALHARFAESRLHGEWFEATDEIMLHVAAICSLTAADFQSKGLPAPDWAMAALEALHADGMLPPHAVELLR